MGDLQYHTWKHATHLNEFQVCGWQCIRLVNVWILHLHRIIAMVSSYHDIVYWTVWTTPQQVIRLLIRLGIHGTQIFSSMRACLSHWIRPSTLAWHLKGVWDVSYNAGFSLRGQLMPVKTSITCSGLFSWRCPPSLVLLSLSFKAPSLSLAMVFESYWSTNTIYCGICMIHKFPFYF